ncbi:MAG: DUF2145 domain-containing protein [Candidatus Methylopumilus sp.]
MHRWMLILLLLMPVTALAGTACTDKPQTAETMRKAFQLAMQTREKLEASGAQVALIGRVGQDLSGYQLKYSHMAFVWRDHPQGRWLVLHELNQCGTADSALYNEGLANFFYDDLFAWDALITIPSPALQARIVEQLTQPALLKDLHQPHYNMVAYPFSTRYQNSNQWVLEVLANAMHSDTVADRAALQGWLKQSGYQPSMLRILALHRLAGRMFRANVAFDDHPGADRLLGKIEVVSVESVTAFVQRQDPLSTTQTIMLQ